ncbi:DUF4177 domain-containing protein [Mesobacterium pallidum]|uniref:DUF4177 domain-containing protein n=1 Tax=Mesobacterium pallidum TaxID=2872037 RepID=UPI001EE3610C|nr:DUF4177 domain-containing protein [Mesobacterium pallidum]
MTRYAYRVVPAPAKGEKAKGVKSAEGRFAHALERLMNEMGAEGWDYLRADTLPSEERTGLTGHVTNWRSVLVFRKALVEDTPLPEAAGDDTAEDEMPETDDAEGEAETETRQDSAPDPDDWTRAAEERVKDFAEDNDSRR